MDNVLYWVSAGVVATFLVTMAIPNRYPEGFFSDFLVGILGALVGGLLFVLLTGIGIGTWIGGIGVAFFGAVMMLVIIRIASRTTTQTKV